MRSETTPTTPSDKNKYRRDGNWLSHAPFSSAHRSSLVAPLVAPVLRSVRLPAHSCHIVVHRLRPAYRCLGSSRHVVLSSCSLVAFYHRPVVAYPIHGSGSAAKGVGSGDGGGAFSMRRFPQLIIVRPIIRFSSSGAASDRFRPPSWRPRRVPHHLIRLIHLTRPIAPALSWIAEGVRYFPQASNGIMASIPSSSS